jgi:hypothetical protein
VRAWSIVPAAINEREIGTDLVCGEAALIIALLLDKGFNGSAFAAQMATAGIEVIIPPTRAQRRTMPKPVQRLIAKFRNRAEASFKEITDQMELARNGAHPPSQPLPNLSKFDRFLSQLDGRMGHGKAGSVCAARRARCGTRRHRVHTGIDGVGAGQR